MANVPNKLSNNSLTKSKPSAPVVKTSKKPVRQDVIANDKSTKKPLDNSDEGIVEGNQILTENLNSENDI